MSVRTMPIRPMHKENLWQFIVIFLDYLKGFSFFMRGRRDLFISAVPVMLHPFSLIADAQLRNYVHDVLFVCLPPP